jgi:hypothetical protein
MIDDPGEETQEPKHSRRRWLWAVLITHLLFALSVAGWWYWPRGDARFVGKWRIEYSPPSPASNQPEMWMEFRASGEAQQYINGRPAFEPSTWWVDGSQLRFCQRYPVNTRGMQRLLSEVKIRWEGKKGFHDGATYQIVGTTPSKLTLQMVTGAKTLRQIYHRLPE